MPLNPNDFRPQDNENTMSTIAGRTADSTLRALKQLYGSHMNFEHCFLEISNFLKNAIAKQRAQGKNVDLFNHHAVALRSIYPGFGAIAYNAQRLEVLAYYWMAANDPDPQIESTVEDRRNNFVEAMYECQRGNNAVGDTFETRNSAVIDFEDNHNEEDWTICNRGVSNKFPERFTAMHYAVKFIAKLNPYTLELIQAFLAEFFYLHGKTHNDLINNADEIFDELVNQDVINQIKNKVIACLGIYNQHEEGLMGDAELKYFKETLNIDTFMYLRFKRSFEDSDRPAENLTRECLTKMIVDANNALANPRNVAIIGMQNLFNIFMGGVASLTHPKLNFDAITNTLRQAVPQPTNAAILYTDNGRQERVQVSDNKVTGDLIYDIWDYYDGSLSRHRQDRVNASWGPQPDIATASTQVKEQVHRDRMAFRNI